MSKGKVLVCVSAADKIRIASGQVVDTGTYLNELVVPVMALIDAGYEITLATPTGRRPIIDAVSKSPTHFGNDEAEYEKALSFFDNAPELKTPRTLRQVLADGLETYLGVFVPGGQAPIVDLAQDEDFGKILFHFHEAAKPTALLCHGPIALLAALTDRRNFRSAIESGDEAAAKSAAAKGWPYAGYNMTIFSNAEEKIVEDQILHGKMEFYVVDALRAAGGNVTSAEKAFQPHVEHDRELITGQNPASDHPLAATLLAALEQRTASKAA